MARRKRQAETAVVNAVLLALGNRPDCRVWRQRAALLWTRPDPSGVPLRAVPDGCADISGLLSDGRRLELECKTSRGRQSAGQKRWQAMVERFGGVYAVVRSAGEAERVVEDALRGGR